MSYSILSSDAVPYQNPAPYGIEQLAALEDPCAPYLRSGYLITSQSANSFVLMRPRPGVSIPVVLLLLAAPPFLLFYLIAARNRRDEWLAPEPPEMSPETRLFFVVTYRAGKAAQIEFNSPRFETADGFSVRETLAQFRRRYGRTQVKAFRYNADGFVGYYYAVRGGLTFMVGIQEYFDDRVRATSLIVHQPGTPIIPDAGGTPAKPTDEVPHGTLERVLSGS